MGSFAGWVGDGVFGTHRDWMGEVGDGVSRSLLEYVWWGGVLAAEFRIVMVCSFTGVCGVGGPVWCGLGCVPSGG